jgi:phage terminase large subunit-like protein
MALPVRSIGKLEQACLDLIAHRHATWPAKGYHFNADLGGRPTRFIEKHCKHYKGEWAGQPMRLGEWQKLINREVFGWVDDLGFRVVRTVWIEVARKNGKSQWGGATADYLLTADGEEGAEIYSSATRRDQAKIVFDAAKMIVKQDDELRSRVKAHRTRLIVESTNSFMEPLSAEAHTLDGLNPHGNFIDEIHAHRSREVWDVLDTAMGARRQPLTWVMTTAGVYSPEAIGWELHDYARQIAEGSLEDDSWFVWISCADEDVPPFGSVAMEQANPNIDVSVHRDYLKKQAEKAQAQPGFANTYKRLHTNVWTQASKVWLPVDKWNDCGGDLPADSHLRTLPCWAGLDLSTKIDLTAFAMAFHDETAGLWHLLMQYYMPGDDIEERGRRDRVPYSRWAEQGLITLTDGNVIDYDYILRDVGEWADEYDIREIAYDPWNAEGTAIKLESEGMTMARMRQGYASLSEPTKEFEKLVVGRQLRHGDDPVLRWMANNVVVTEDPAGNQKPDKAKSRQRIDGIVAAIMAVGRGLVAGGKRSVYEDRGMTLIQ